MSTKHIISDRAPMSVKVGLNERAYEIIIGDGLLDICTQWIKPFLPRPFVAIVTDENVAEYQLKRLLTALSAGGITSSVITLPAGESTKSFTQLERLCSDLLAAGIERNDVIIAFGGGVIGDITGFAASILRRGCRFIQIPTSLLAQVDSSVGGKTAINSQYGKNLIGAFHQPILVLADILTLDTLPTRELRAGYAEIVKYGLLGDAEFFDWLEANGRALLEGEKAARITAVTRSCTAKAQIVEQDEREGGVRALLNLGHTFGHALEVETGYSEILLHGEGVALGMVLAFDFSRREGHCPVSAFQRVIAHLEETGLPTRLADINSLDTSPQALLKAMYQDKKVERGALTFILANGIGETFIQKNVAPEKIESFLDELMQ